jgi:3-oxoacyl-[acyl-carrier-protein] synthase II
VTLRCCAGEEIDATDRNHGTWGGDAIWFGRGRAVGRVVSFPSRLAGEVPAFKVTEYVPKSYRKATKIMARDIELAVAAADFAVRDGRVATRGMLETGGVKLLAEGYFKPDPVRVGCNIGSGLICADMDELSAALIQARDAEGNFSLSKWGKSEDPAKNSGMDHLTPLWLLKYLPNMLASHVSIIHDIQGPSNTITCGQASAGLALAEATRTIQRGHADLALVGGGETKVHPMGLMRWTLLNRLNISSNDDVAHACLPMDQRAGGAVLAEGAAVLIIEELEHAKKRGATIYAEVVGLGATSNGYAIADTDPTGEPLSVAMKKALRDAKVETDAVQMVVPPGYGIPSWDAADAAAIKRVFGEKPRQAVVPLRGGIGDCGAGAQAIDLFGATMALHSQTIPGNPRITTPLAGLNVPTQTESAALEHVLIASTSLGGQNAAVLLKRYQA